MKHKQDWQGSAPTDAQLSEVLSMEDDRLREIVRAIAQAGGMSAGRAEAMTRDADAIRRKLSTVRAEDLQKALSQISPEQMAALTEQMQKLKQKNH